MKKKVTTPKWGKEDTVFVSISNKEMKVKDVQWNGRTWMYSFYDTDMRCGEEYLFIKSYQKS